MVGVSTNHPCINNVGLYAYANVFGGDTNLGYEQEKSSNLPPTNLEKQ
jgi:hypothetical protein